MTSRLFEAMLLAQVAATLIMTGVIWFVQIVHYPLLARVGLAEFAAYESAHVRLTTWVVAPPMVVEAATALLLNMTRPAHVSAVACWAAFYLLVVIWASTIFIQAPRHEALIVNFDPHVHRLLVLSNWVRTVAWTARSSLVLLILRQAAFGGAIRG